MGAVLRAVLRKERAEKGHQLMTFELVGASHRIVARGFHDHRNGPEREIAFTAVGGRVGQTSTPRRAEPTIVVELEVDVPEAPLMTDGRQVLRVGSDGVGAGGGGHTHAPTVSSKHAWTNPLSEPSSSLI